MVTRPASLASASWINRSIVGSRAAVASAAGLHILGHLEDLTGHLGSDTAGSLGDLQTTENITLGMIFRLLEGSTRRPTYLTLHLCRSVESGTTEMRLHRCMD
jgi:hypothetical protein